MKIKFLEVDFPEIRKAVELNIGKNSAPIDSYLEDHIFESNHYNILLAGQTAGFASIHQGGLVTQYSLDDSFKSYGQAVYQQLRRMEEVRAALVPTCDEFFLAHALDDYLQLHKQAYFFMAREEIIEINHDSDAKLLLASEQDVSFIKKQSGDFFDGLEKMVDLEEIYKTFRNEECVGFGVLVRSKLYYDVASIGMFTIERFRNTGIGTLTIKLLIKECRKQNLRPVAGCWYYNHVSKKTLERAGMYSRTRLLRIEY